MSVADDKPPAAFNFSSSEPAIFAGSPPASLNPLDHGRVHCPRLLLADFLHQQTLHASPNSGASPQHLYSLSSLIALL